MRVAFYLVAIPLFFILAVGCKFDDHDRPKTKPDGAKRDTEEKKNPVAQNNPEQKPSNKQGVGGVVREPKSLLGNVRARADQASLENELRQIALFYNQFCGDLPNPNSRTLDRFLDYIKRDAPKIHDAIKADQYYTVNVKARLGSENIIAYETEIYTKGYACIKADGFIGFVSAEELKAGLSVP